MNFEKIINFINNKYHHKRIVKFINRDKITKLIDVGAHKGEFLQDFLKFKSIKTVYAFEPQIEIFKILSKNLKKYEHIKKNNIALDAKSGNKIKYILIEKQFFNLHQGYNFNMSHKFMLKNNFILVKKFIFPLMNFEDRLYINGNYKIK